MYSNVKKVSKGMKETVATKIKMVILCLFSKLTINSKSLDYLITFRVVMRLVDIPNLKRPNSRLVAYSPLVSLTNFQS